MEDVAIVDDCLVIYFGASEFFSAGICFEFFVGMELFSTTNYSVRNYCESGIRRAKLNF